MLDKNSTIFVGKSCANFLGVNVLEKLVRASWDEKVYRKGLKWCPTDEGQVPQVLELWLSYGCFFHSL